MNHKNPKYIQDYLRKYKCYSEKWTEEERERYIQTAEFNVIDKVMIFEDMHPYVFRTIITVLVAVIANLIFTLILAM